MVQLGRRVAIANYATSTRLNRMIQPGRSVVRSATSFMPSLPQEVIDNILGQVDDPVHLWVNCRQVSQAFRHQVEYIISKTWLQDTSLKLFRHGSISSWGFEAAFSRVDGDSAFFKVQLHQPWDVFTPVSLAPKLRDLHGFVDTYNKHSSSMDFFFQHRSVTRIGKDTNNSYFSDLPIPQLVVHAATEEISMDWKSHFAKIFREEHVLRNLKALNNISSPPFAPITTTYPIVVEIRWEDFHFWTEDTYTEHRLRVEIRYRRALALGWARALSRGENYDKAIASADTRFQMACHAMRLQDIMVMCDLDFADCRGMLIGVEDPGLHGWKQWKYTNMSENEWFNHAWENPEHGGETTVAEQFGDEEMVEVERLARAWEKGMAWDYVGDVREFEDDGEMDDFEDEEEEVDLFGDGMEFDE